MKSTTNYYNEIDPFAAAWLRELIKSNLIAKGEVDERDIRDIKPSELRGYTQCHFFAGIGVWSYALRQAGWPDDRPVWTGSCPCQPFSAAGKRKGVADERHLWPSWFHLIQECRPIAIFGEQVKAAIKQGWLDLVQDDLEGIGYTLGAVPFPACSVGAPHIRQRLYWVGNSCSKRRQQVSGSASCDEETNGRTRWDGGKSDSNYISSRSGENCTINVDNAATKGLSLRPSETLFGSKTRGQYKRSGDAGSVVYPSQQQMGIPGCARESRSADGVGQADAQQHERGQECSDTGRSNSRSGAKGLEQRSLHCSPGGMGLSDSSGSQSGNETSEAVEQRDSTLTAGFWSGTDWLWCRDEKYRPVEPGTFPLAHGSPNRVGRLRGYGNAIVAPQAQAFIESYLEQEKNGSNNSFTN